MDFPVASANYPQAANVVVNDITGQPVAGAVVQGIYHTPSGDVTVYFPDTDADGRTRVPLELPAISATQTVTLTVYAVEGGKWGQGVTSFQIKP